MKTWQVIAIVSAVYWFGFIWGSYRAYELCTERATVEVE